MNGSDDSNRSRRGFASAEELDSVADRSDNCEDGFDDYDRERETMEFPESMPRLQTTVVIKDADDTPTLPPPPELGHDPAASILYFQKIDDENSGEAARIEGCKTRLRRVWSALSNREFRPESHFLRSIILMPFPLSFLSPDN